MGEVLGYASLQTQASFPLQLLANIGQPSKAGALEAFWAPVLTKTQPLQASLTLFPYGGK